jgi:protein-disulfide isomerase
MPAPSSSACTRRRFAALSATLGLLAMAGRASAQDGAGVDQLKLMAPQALPDQVVGNPLAKVTVVEYASMTCGHCANFHNDTYPAFKAKYIDTGKVRYIMREFPLDPVAAASFMLARCAGEGKYYPIVEHIFKNQKAIVTAEKIDVALLEHMKSFGFTQESFNTCLKDQKLYEDVVKVKDGGSGFGVDSTPTFFINGAKRSGALTMADLETIIDPLIATN